MFDITMDVQSMFFDKKPIVDAVDRATRRAIVKSLAFVRRRRNVHDWFLPSPRQARRIAPDQKRRKRSVRIAARPSAGPALVAEAAAGNILSPWANVVTD